MFRHISRCAALVIVVVICCLFVPAKASPGDRSEAYQACLKQCTAENCSDADRLAHFTSQQWWYLAVFGWECDDECRYQCMWVTVTDFQRKGQEIPQFHGKWPFVRLYGIQEPASALFSILNGYTHYYMWRKFNVIVPLSSPYYIVWNVQAIVTINAWIWSTVFHSRDMPATEKLDYFCAFSVVLYALYCLVFRMCVKSPSWVSITAAIPFLTYFFYHIYYLTFIHFDYGFNMKASVIVGGVNSVGWLVWCYTKRHRKYVWQCVLSVVIINVLLLLELGDFPPWYFVLDAHALWHFGTIPVPFLWYRFLMEDCLYEVKTRQVKVN